MATVADNVVASPGHPGPRFIWAVARWETTKRAATTHARTRDVMANSRGELGFNQIAGSAIHALDFHPRSACPSARAALSATQ
jgi:hypothetical protein